MRRLSPLDELLAHQTPEPILTPAIEHPYWRESYFFEAHGPDPDSDVIALGFATYPQRQHMDAVLLGRIDGTLLLAHADRPWGDDPHTTEVGPVRVDIVEPFRRIHLRIDDFDGFSCDLTFSARTGPYGLRRGRMVDDDGLLIWDQSHMIQSGTWAGRYVHRATKNAVEGWVGQRDHSWGVRDHGRAPLWIWAAVQLDDGMLGAWHWEWHNGAPIFTDGCWAPADGGEPVAVTRFEHELQWVDSHGNDAVFVGNGDDVAGITARMRFELEDGHALEITGRGTWAARYTPFHAGGQHLLAVSTDDGRTGTAIVEVTGSNHHRYFPFGFQPDGS